MPQAQTQETLYDYKNRLDWVKKLGWSDAKLKKIPVHHQQTDQQPFISLTEVDPRHYAKLYIYKNDVPEGVWTALSNFIANLGGPSGFEQQGFEGTDVWEHLRGRGKSA